VKSDPTIDEIASNEIARLTRQNVGLFTGSSVEKGANSLQMAFGLPKVLGKTKPPRVSSWGF
jgi:hypothetical protein